MLMLRCTGLPGLMLTVLASAAAFAASPDGDGYQPPMTPWGTPDIAGTWDFRSLVPLERPADLGEQAYLTPEEAHERRQAALKQAAEDIRSDDAALDVEGGYDRIYLDRATGDDSNLQTSLIIDPPDGQLPALTPQARARMEAQTEARTPPVRDYSQPASAGALHTGGGRPVVVRVHHHRSVHVRPAVHSTLSHA